MWNKIKSTQIGMSLFTGAIAWWFISSLVGIIMINNGQPTLSLLGAFFFPIWTILGIGYDNVFFFILNLLVSLAIILGLGVNVLTLFRQK